LIAGVAIALSVMKTEFHVEVQGELRPEETAEIFAPADGEITELLVDDGAAVRAQQVLLRLASPWLDLQVQQVQGEYETARKRLEGIEAARVRLSSTDLNAATRLSQLSAEQEELKAHLGSKQLELNLLRVQRDALQLRSPLDGRVMTWDAARLLANRPVRRGQALMAIADTKGDWFVHLFVPQRSVGYLLAVDGQDSPVVEFYLATEPNRVLRADVVEIAPQVEWNDEMKEHVVLAKARMDRSSSNEMRPGSVVYGQIACGQRSIGYVWLHELIERLRGRWLLFTASEK
jgi:multidrug efflux pump subunit AcrA (membrane-fusion protein)